MILSENQDRINNLKNRLFIHSDEAKAETQVRGESEIFIWDAKIIPTYEDSKSERKRRQGLLDHDKAPNLVVDDGLIIEAKLVIAEGGYASFVQYCGVSDNTGAVTNASHDLGGTMEKIAVTERFTNVNVLECHTFWDTTQGNVGAGINKTGLFNSTSAYVSTPVMYCARNTNTTKVKDSSKTMTVAWAVTKTAI